MNAYEMRALSDQDLSKELESSLRELLNVRFRLATKQMADTAQIRVVKKNIARLNTIIGERQLGAGRNVQ
jgi:large subunit ribosomal protein L29